jgi:hypothetical protein
MKTYKVKHAFIDKDTKKRYVATAPFKTDDESRAKELQEKGLIEEVNPNEVNADPENEDEFANILNQAAEKVFTETEGMSREDFEKLLELETEGKNRKTVKEHFEAEIKAIGEDNGKGES